MPSRLNSAVLPGVLAAAVLAASVLACGSALAQTNTSADDASSTPMAEIVISPAGGHELTLVGRLQGWASESYAREPELTTAIAAIGVLLPVVSLAALAFAWGARRSRGAEDGGHRRTRSRRSPWREATHVMSPAPAGAAVEPHALLRLEGEPATELPINGNMVRIGRHEENDIRLQSKTVHRYHAVMHVTPERDYVITDLSGEEGNGVFVNGKRIEQVTLKGEDLIELGEARLRFQIREMNSRAG